MPATLHPQLPCLRDYLQAIQTGWLDDAQSKPANIIVRDMSFVVSDEKEGGELISYDDGVVPVTVRLSPNPRFKTSVTVRAVVRLGRVVAILTDPRSVP